MNEYNEANPPKYGNARKIWRALKDAGWTVYGLRYNPNLWGRGGGDGWGTWACELKRGWRGIDCWCGIDSQGRVYLERTTAPYSFSFVEPIGSSVETTCGPVEEAHDGYDV